MQKLVRNSLVICIFETCILSLLEICTCEQLIMTTILGTYMSTLACTVMWVRLDCTSASHIAIWSMTTDGVMIILQ